MASKRARSPELVANPFIKKRNLAWSLDDFPEPTSSRGSPSPPAKRRPSRAGPPSARQEASPQQQSQPPGPAAPSSAAIEAGKARITNHAEHFASLLSSHALRHPFPAGAPRLSVRAYRALFESSLGSPTAAHFVIHQHDHPVAGTHYDLRLQINGSSSASWAVMYGPPGAPNGARQARNATETRVHCLWNHLVETASRETGSLLIWDTGTYSVLPAPRARETRYRRQRWPRRSSLSDREEEEEEGEKDERTEQQKLAAAFAARKIRVRLDGARLPRPYVLYLRLTKDEDAAGRAKAARSASAPRRRTRRTRTTAPAPEETSSSSSGGDSSGNEQDHDEDDEVVDPGQTVAAAAEAEEISAMDRELRELEDAEVRRTNAYPGATNSIGSVHQRKWYLSMDREACGFVRRRRHGRVVWEEEEAKAQEDDAGQADRGGDSTIASSSRLTYPFFVRGVEHERSVVTGRLGAEILRDEGITDYVGRMGWRPVLR